MVLLVGGHSRKIGKTSVVAGLIRALREAGWSAVKITSHAHGGGERADVPFTVHEEIAPGSTDSGRYLAAGALRSWWLRAERDQLPDALPWLKRVIDSSPNTIIESNSIREFLQPDLYLAVADASVGDWKESAGRLLHLADAWVLVEREQDEAGLREIAPGLDAPRFRVSPPDYMSEALAGFVRSRMG